MQQLHAQDNAVPDLQQINSAVKNVYAKVEDLDKVQQELKYFDEHPVTTKEQQDLLLASYRALAQDYSSNNHFKQGYQVYQHYLSLKEDFMAKEKAEAIAKLTVELQDKQKKYEEAALNMQNRVIQLQMDNDYLQSKRKSFKHYFSLGIIALTVIFAFLLLQAGIKLTRLRHDVKAGRDRLKLIHRIAVLGKLRNGVKLSMANLFASLKKTSAETAKQVEQLGQLSGEKNPDLVAIRKHLNELKNLGDE